MRSSQEFGCRWQQISKFIPTRTEHAIRNRWHRLQSTLKGKEPGQAVADGSKEAYPISAMAIEGTASVQQVGASCEEQPAREPHRERGASEEERLPHKEQSPLGPAEQAGAAVAAAELPLAAAELPLAAAELPTSQAGLLPVPIPVPVPYLARVSSSCGESSSILLSRMALSPKLPPMGQNPTSTSCTPHSWGAVLSEQVPDAIPLAVPHPGLPQPGEPLHRQLPTLQPLPGQQPLHQEPRPPSAGLAFAAAAIHTSTEPAPGVACLAKLDGAAIADCLWMKHD